MRSCRTQSPNAYEKVVDRLLASPRYGERMAARWLDAARYADTNGYQTDAERSMWRWRDWVIDAFNRNMPYDRFTVEQIAGDMLPDATRDQKIATGFNRNHRANGEGGIIPEEYAVEYVVDRVETTSTVWLGVTLGLRPLPQPQVRSVHAERVLPDLRVLQQRAGARQRVQVRQLAAGDRGAAAGAGGAAEGAGTAAGDGGAAGRRRWSRGLRRRRLPGKRRCAGSAVGLGAVARRRRASAAGRRFERRDHSRSAALGKISVPDGERSRGRAVSLHRQGRLEERRPRNTAPVRWARLASSTASDMWMRQRRQFRILRFVHILGMDQPDRRLRAPSSAARTMKPRARASAWCCKDGHLSANLVQRWLDDGVRVESEETVPLNRWSHVILTYDGSRLASGVRLYLDGRPAARPRSIWTT